MFANDRDIFLNELEDYIRNVLKLKERSIRIYLNRIRKLLDSGYSVNDLCESAEQLWEAYGSKGQLYDAKDHGNTRAAVKHVAGLVRLNILEKLGCPYVSYEVGWSSFRPSGKYESGYTIQDGIITFSYNKGFTKGKTLEKKISNSDIKKLIDIFERAHNIGCLASSGTCINTIHGNRNKFDYSFKEDTGNDCCLFEGDTAYVNKLHDEYYALIQKQRS